MTGIAGRADRVRQRLATADALLVSDLTNIRWLTGFTAAQLALGRLFVEGRGVPQDPRQAAAWFERAAAQG